METTFLTIAFFFVAILYATVGQGGGSGYLATMSLASLPPETMRTTALALNILVAGIGTYKFHRAGYFDPALFWPVAIASIPLAFLGGRLTLAAAVYRPLVGVVLLYAAVRLLQQARAVEQGRGRVLSPWLALLLGAGIGLLSGLLGLGGGILLSPVLLLGGWTDTHHTMATSSAFVLANSLAGFLGRLSEQAPLPASLPLWLLVVGVGGWIGAEFGSRRLNATWLRRLLALVLALGGLKMVWL